MNVQSGLQVDVQAALLLLLFYEKHDVLQHARNLQQYVYNVYSIDI